MANVKDMPPYEKDKEVTLSTIKDGREFLLSINGMHSLYIRCKVGNSPIYVHCTQAQPNKNILICNLATGRLINKHPLQPVVPAYTEVSAKIKD